MASDLKLEVQGIKELRAELKSAEGNFPKELQRANKRIVEDVVVPAAKERGSQARTNLIGGPARLGSKGVASIRGLATQTEAKIGLGTATKIPWAFGSEWGSKRYNQFPPSSSTGYILRPTVKDKQSEIIDAYLEMLDDLTKRAFPE